MENTEWEKKSQGVFEFLNEKLLLNAAAKTSNGSWEFVSMVVYVDGVYQYALHLLGVAMEQSKTITPEELPQYYGRLRSVVQALDKVMLASDSVRIFSLKDI